MRRLLAIAAALAALAPQAHAADVVRGANIYRMHCAACHGANGVASMPNAPSFQRAERLMQPDMTLLASIKTGKGIMPGFVGILNDREILDVVGYLRTMR